MKLLSGLVLDQKSIIKKMCLRVDLGVDFTLQMLTFFLFVLSY